MTEAIAISAPAPSAVQEAMNAMRTGKHVVLLSTGVTLAEEAELKHQASERGLLLLGPECGTSIVDGEGFGIWNSVRRGPIGIACNTGSGIQELSCLVDKVGISHAFGVGTRDFSQKIGGAGILSALKFLAADDKTRVILVAARFPTTTVARRMLDAVKGARKPAVVCFLGVGGRVKFPNGVVPAQTLEEAATHAVSLAEKRNLGETIFALSPDQIKKIAKSEYSRFGYGQRYIRGLYSGGMLCTEAQVILRKLVGTVRSNLPLELRSRLPDAHSSRGHACVDMGAPDLSGKDHPAIDLRPRCERLLKEAKCWDAAVVALDVILGHGAHPDPAGGLARAVEEAKQIADRGGGHLSVVAAIVGTSKDPQNLSLQREKLENAGVIIMPSNAQASRMAALIATTGDAWKKLKD
jgi:succinyl-CoA synthetase alpha subunit